MNPNPFTSVLFIALCASIYLCLRYLGSVVEITTATTAVCVAVFAIGFFCTQFLSHVLTLDSLLTFLLTIWISIVGGEWLKMFKPDAPVDALHEYLLYHVAAATMVPALVWFLCTDPYDVTMRTALAFSRMMGFGTLTILTILEQNSYFVGFQLSRLWGAEDGGEVACGELMDPLGYLHAVVPLATMAVSYGVHLFYNSRVRAFTCHGNLNQYLFADQVTSSIVAFVCAFFNFSLAKSFEQSLDRLHVYLYRCLGVMTLSQASLSWIATRYRSVANKRAYLFSKALSCLVMLLVSMYMCRSGLLPDAQGTRLLVIALIVVTLPSAIGSMRHDVGQGWDLPWKGLRVPDVKVGGGQENRSRSRSRSRSPPRKSRSRSRTSRKSSRGRKRKR